MLFKAITGLYILGGVIGYCVAHIVYPEAPGLGELIFLVIEYDYFRDPF
jgi:hypothetical protein